jgi:hypothetical protein
MAIQQMTTWKKSVRSGNGGNCVEVAQFETGINGS